MTEASKLTVLLRGEEESWGNFLRRVREAEGEVIVVLSRRDNTLLLAKEDRQLVISELARIRYRVKLASKEPIVIAAARGEGMQVLTRTRELKQLLVGHPKIDEALRFFSPSLWRQHWRSRLQKVGLLSMPKTRIWVLISLSCGLFLFVVFRLLPSADIRIWPRRDLVSHTMNVVLAASGAEVPVPQGMRVLPLKPISVRVDKTISFADISPEFNGTDAKTQMQIRSRKKEALNLRKGTRLLNQAGMIFKIQRSISIPAGGTTTVAAIADHLDLYGKVLGDRGNVPAGVQWTVPGLPEEDQLLVTATNTVPATGGVTSFRRVLQQKDIDLAQKRLEQELLSTAKQLMTEQREELNVAEDADYQFLEGRAFLRRQNKEIVRLTYTGFVLPMAFLGQSVESVPVQGSLIYTTPAFDSRQLLAQFREELLSRISDGRRLLSDTVAIDPQRVVVIDYAPNLSWIKMTVDLVGTEEYVLDPFSVQGARFGKRVRDAVVALDEADALRILRNFPEVDKVDIRIWPPWSKRVPSLPSSISISPQR